MTTYADVAPETGWITRNVFSSTSIRYRVRILDDRTNETLDEYAAPNADLLCTQVDGWNQFYRDREIEKRAVAVTIVNGVETVEARR